MATRDGGGGLPRWLTIGITLVVLWIVLKVVLKLAGAVFHLLLIIGLIALVWALARKAWELRRPPDRRY